MNPVGTHRPRDCYWNIINIFIIVKWNLTVLSQMSVFNVAHGDRNCSLPLRVNTVTVQTCYLADLAKHLTPDQMPRLRVSSSSLCVLFLHGRRYDSVLYLYVPPDTLISSAHSPLICIETHKESLDSHMSGGQSSPLNLRLLSLIRA